MGSFGSAHPSSYQTWIAESRQISSFGINFTNTIPDGETNFNMNNDTKQSLVHFNLLLLYILFRFYFTEIKILYSIEFLSKIICYT